jgi:chemotaxis protein histidine kinase CheA/ActR/RegA family two-component response regulator
MNDDLDFQESLDRYFEIEAAELLQTIEETLMMLVEEKNIERVHTLMRSAHTIKGSAANCGYKTIETIAHHLEDVFQALYPPELEIDTELGVLLLEGYECLYQPLSAQLAGLPYDEAATLERTAELFARLQTHLGDFFGRETPLPTAAELGFDVIGSIFTDSIPQDLEVLADAIATQNVAKVHESLISLAEFLLELGGSYSLPGIATIATTTLTALERHPSQVLAIAQIALSNFEAAQIAIVGGDRSVGGQVSAELNAWLESNPSTNLFEAEDRSTTPSQDNSADWLSLVDANSADSIGAVAEEIDKTSTADNSADWLSLMDTDSTAPVVVVEEIEKPSTADDSADWLSLMDTDSTAPVVVVEEIEKPSTADDSADWLSLMDTDSTAPVVVVEEIEKPSTADDSADWLSLMDTDSTAPVVVVEEIEKPSTVDDSADWLSLMDTDSAKSIIDLEEPNSDAIEIEEFEPEPIELTTSSSLTRTKYPIDKTEIDSSSALTISNLSGIDRIFQSIALDAPQAETTEEDLKPPSTTPPAQDSQVSVRVATIQLERLSHTIGELLIDDNQQHLRAEQLEGLAQSTIEQYRRCEHRLRLVSDWADKYNSIGQNTHSLSRKSAHKPKQKTKTTEVQSQFDSLELDVYSDLSILLQNLTDEIAECGVRVETLVENTKKSRFILSKRKQLLADAQTELFAARMVEVSTVLNRFPRLLQQMVASHRKPAQLELIGTTVSIDKIIAEKLYDPLLHLIRNAYDHGVESPETRRQQGKPDVGQLTIKAYHHGNRTAIEVSDDGQGLNWVKIRQRAIDLNLLPANRAESATESELSEIMFAPGFSTAEKVNDLSGRGIGLDVVRDRIGALQGSIDVRSVSGKGTTFVMQFPLNLTTARLLICESAGVVHALRSEAIAQVLLPAADRIQSQSALSEKGASRFLRWGEGSSQKLIPIYPLNDLLEYHCPIVASTKEDGNLFPIKANDRAKSLLLLEIDERQICIEVDRILVEQELVVKSLGQTFGLPSYIQGYSVLGDGGLTLSLDPVELIAQTRLNSTPTFHSSKLALAPALQAALAPASDDTIDAEIVDTPTNNTPSIGKIQVLVVDDSLVQRQTLARSLTKAGCQVILASHGREGLIKLQEHPRIRLVVCDIEMPQMNGFEFLSHCRQDAKFSQIPIVMLTTRGGQKHRQLAMTLGAKDYLTKPQSERELLDIIAKLSADPVGV